MVVTSLTLTSLALKIPSLAGRRYVVSAQNPCPKDSQHIIEETRENTDLQCCI